MVEISSLYCVSNLASYFIAAMWVAKTSYCSSSTLVTFSWNAKYSYLLSPRIVLFIALISSLILRLFCSTTMSYNSIYSSIFSVSFTGAGCGFWLTLIDFLIEFIRFLSFPVYFSGNGSFTDRVSWSLVISFGGSLGMGWLLALGGILLCEFLGYKPCFWFCGILFECISAVTVPFLLLLLSSFLIFLILSVLWIFSLILSFFNSMLLLL